MKNRSLFIFILSSLFFSSCGESVQEQNDTFQAETARRENPFHEEEAELIIGAPVHLSETGTTRTINKLIYSTTFTADSADSKGRTGVLYFMYFEYSDIDSAKHSYTSIKAANADHEGIETLDSLGDEAYFHSDGENFYLIMVRKGNKELRIKLNKITDTSTKENFLAAARKITETM